MKSVTEFRTHKLVQGMDSRAALIADGKTPEEIEASIGEAFKMEGEKLKIFITAMGVAEENKEKLSRIRVLSPGEGETLPKDAVQIEEHVYLPEFVKAAPTVDPKKAAGKKGGGPGKGKRKDGPKSSPWGITPEEAAAKKAGAKDKSKGAPAK